MNRIHFLLAVVLLAGCTVQQQEKACRMDYPHAEWDKAGVILMHTPGQELFDGVIHPSAGLFAREHRKHAKGRKPKVCGG